MKRILLLGAGLLAGCTTTAPPPAPAVHAPPPTGLDRVVGKDARALQILFGVPDLDVREGTARKLQYAGPICVLDAYLYPPASGQEPVVRHLDARTPAGDDFDRASCIAALSRRVEAR
ncbi:hypothetical protein SAMN06295912_11724 [Sphingomonas laterariae]|uniref:Lipoprotein n=1 Tax=Edaphosphingomonas laterariae TaxID=861865 RepID=A0A239HI40_9SPHN|nr:hypothetical protein [Sphingomonas laterariae]SNS80718.1 hypothetical protein SAMN06295912_11724 [Sphingomonas laterariae]